MLRWYFIEPAQKERNLFPMLKFRNTWWPLIKSYCWPNLKMYNNSNISRFILSEMRVREFLIKDEKFPKMPICIDTNPWIVAILPCFPLLVLLIMMNNLLSFKFRLKHS